MKEKESSVSSVVKKGIDFLNRHGAYSSTEEIKQLNWQFKTNLLNRFKDFLPDNPVGVDIGAADGMMSEIMRQHRSIALDPIPQVENQTQIPFTRAIAEQLPFPTDSLDYITILYSLHHFSNSKKSLEECARVLKTDALLIIMEEFPRYKGQEYFLKINDKSVNSIVFGSWKQEDIEKYTETINYLEKRSFESFIINLGFEMIDYKKYPPTKWWDVAFKSSKNFYVFKKNVFSNN